MSATVQANLERSRADAEALAEGRVPIRLVKGAYAEDPGVARRWGEPTDLAFLELAHELHANGAEVAIATHDALLREALLRALPDIGVEMLLGVRSADARVLAGRGVPVRIYVPYGDGWFRYAMRRWAESVGPMKSPVVGPCCGTIEGVTWPTPGRTSGRLWSGPETNTGRR